jgi:hypothetical protein
MSMDTTQPNYTAQTLAAFAVAIALAGGLLWALTRGHDPVVVTAETTCDRFSADAVSLFENGSRATLSGTFAPGDHVQLAFDFTGGRHAFEMTGVLARPKDPKLKGSGMYDLETTTTTTAAALTVSRGTMSGIATMNLVVDVETTGEGSITINKAYGTVRIASASCEVSKKKPDARAVRASVEPTGTRTTSTRTHCVLHSNKC